MPSLWESNVRVAGSGRWRWYWGCWSPVAVLAVLPTHYHGHLLRLSAAGAPRRHTVCQHAPSGTVVEVNQQLLWQVFLSSASWGRRVVVGLFLTTEAVLMPQDRSSVTVRLRNWKLETHSTASPFHVERGVVTLSWPPEVHNHLFGLFLNDVN